MFKKIASGVALTFLTLTLGAGPTQEKSVTLTKGNFVVMDQIFTDESVAKVLMEAQAVDAKMSATEWGPKKPLYLVLMSPGGSIDSGLSLIDNLNSLGRPVNTITIFSASMAFHTAQSLNGTRYITKTGTLMSHKAKGQFAGEFPGQLDTRYAYYLKRLKHLDERVVERSKGKYTMESYTKAYEQELWCDGQDCVNLGLADSATNVYCDSTLQGPVSSDMTISFMGISIPIEVVKPGCPTILGILDIKVKTKDSKKVSVKSLADLRKVPEFSQLSPDSLFQLQQHIQSTVEGVVGQKHEIVRY